MKLVITLLLLITIFASIEAKFRGKKYLSKHHAKFQMRNKMRVQHRHRARFTHSHKRDDPVTTSSSSSSSSTTTTTSSTVTSSPAPPPAPLGYPKCASSDFADPCLNTWIPEKKLADLLVAPDFPADKCVIPNAVAGAAAGPGGKAAGKPMKHMELKKKRVSVGYASYFLDQTDYLFLNSFEAEIKSNWKAFWTNALAGIKGDADKMDGLIDMAALKKTITDSKWEKAETLNFEKLTREYALDSEKYEEDKTGLNIQEFVYMNIRENIKADVKSSAATNNFIATKKDIQDFFDYLDCNKDGNISAENVYNGMKNMKEMQYKKTTTTMINAFFVNTMEHSSAALDNIDFLWGILVGMYERIVFEHSISEVQLNSMKVARRSIITGGGGPMRRK